MKPVSPVLPRDRGGITPGREAVFGAKQSQYIGLPALRSIDGVVTSRWALTWSERLRLLLTGNIWAQQMTFGSALQPIRLTTEEPAVEDCI